MVRNYPTTLNLTKVILLDPAAPFLPGSPLRALSVYSPSQKYSVPPNSRKNEDPKSHFTPRPPCPPLPPKVQRNNFLKALVASLIRS